VRAILFFCIHLIEICQSQQQQLQRPILPIIHGHRPLSAQQTAASSVLNNRNVPTVCPFIPLYHRGEIDQPDVYSNFTIMYRLTIELVRVIYLRNIANTISLAWDRAALTCPMCNINNDILLSTTRRLRSTRTFIISASQFGYRIRQWGLEQ
jgi:hypothetical protein